MLKPFAHEAGKPKYGLPLLERRQFPEPVRQLSRRSRTLAQGVQNWLCGPRKDTKMPPFPASIPESIRDHRNYMAMLKRRRQRKRAARNGLALVATIALHLGASSLN